tara:strand:- start:299 stop:670 length:372 start_codon:yes stop_codon:yes gene_type:complete
MSRSQVTKGKVGERELAKLLEENGVRAWRGAQHSGKAATGEPAPDIVTPDLPCHFESKRCERLNIWDAMEQAQADALDDEMPIVAWRKNRKPWLFVVQPETFLSLIKAYYQGEEPTQIPDPNK